MIKILFFVFIHVHILGFFFKSKLGLIVLNWNYLWKNPYLSGVIQFNSPINISLGVRFALAYIEQKPMMNVLLYFALVPNTSPCYVNFVKKKKKCLREMEWNDFLSKGNICGKLRITILTF